MNKELTAKDFAIKKVNEIREICYDLKYINNKELKNEAIDRIDYLSKRILEHLEYLDIKNEEE